MSVRWQTDLRAHTTPIENQQSRPVCLALATTSARRLTDDFSAEYLHYWSEAHSGRGRFESVEAVMAARGQPPESQWPFDNTVDETSATYGEPPSVVGPFARANFDVLLAPAFDQVWAEVDSGIPVVLGFQLVDSIYTPPDGLVLDGRLIPLGHAVACVGTAQYAGPALTQVADGERLLCFQNSWGSDWGDSGYGYLPAATFGRVAVQAGTIHEP